MWFYIQCRRENAKAKYRYYSLLAFPCLLWLPHRFILLHILSFTVILLMSLWQMLRKFPTSYCCFMFPYFLLIYSACFCHFVNLFPFLDTTANFKLFKQGCRLQVASIIIDIKLFHFSTSHLWACVVGATLQRRA